MIEDLASIATGLTKQISPCGSSISPIFRSRPFYIRKYILCQIPCIPMSDVIAGDVVGSRISHYDLFYLTIQYGLSSIY